MAAEERCRGNIPALREVIYVSGRRKPTATGGAKSCTAFTEDSNERVERIVRE
jgi:hypothetical protein